MFLAGIIIHVSFLFSIFDIYFKSPIVNNVIPYEPEHEALAERLVLFVVDGLRAESFVNYTTMPNLRTIANSHGRWGISYTQVPTESRPGHVALIAGFYEDPSAVLKGWKENPVDFDSVFNQTSQTWCWGAYDILNIFTKGHFENHIVVNDFDPYDDTYNIDKNTTFLDKWVFDSVQNFFDKAKNDTEVREKLKKPKIVLFLHLLGTDTSGHKHKPKTENFLTTLKFVDNGIIKMEKIIRDYYGNDGKTTFLMTSDHGMTDWGSHGSGDDHETETPYVIWGSGIKQVKKLNSDPYTFKMSLEHRFDMNQVDLSPLMSTVLSIPVPVNSIGQLKTEILDMTLENKAKAIYSNSRQLASQYNKKREDVETNAISMLYFPFKQLDKGKYDEFIIFSKKLLTNKDYEKLITSSKEIIHLSLMGLKYYHNYYQIPLLIMVTLSFMGWILCLLQMLLEQKIKTSFKATTTVKTLNYYYIINVKKGLNVYFIILGILAVTIINVQSLPVQYYIYFLMPIYLWHHASMSLEIWMQAFTELKRKKQIFQVCVQVICYTVGSICLGLSFTYRWMLSFPLLGMAVWPYVSNTQQYLTHSNLIVWVLGCLSLILFAFIPVVGKGVFIELVILAGGYWLLTIVMSLAFIFKPLYLMKQETQKEIYITMIQMSLMSLSLIIIYYQSKNYDQGLPVIYFYQCLAWVISIISWVLPLCSTNRLICRMFSIGTSILNFYLLLSVFHEGMFMVLLILKVLGWILIEVKLLNIQKQEFIDTVFERIKSSSLTNLPVIERSISNQDFRRSFFFIVYIIVAFFGTGNIASINSFEIRWVICFITSFQPYVITSLILMKTLSPFLIVGCGFRGIQQITKAPTASLHIIVLIYSNIMGIQLLYNVKNTGSWLEIGTSISQFVIVQVITLFIVLIAQIAKFLTEVNLVNITYKIFQEGKKYV